MLKARFAAAFIRLAAVLDDIVGRMWVWLLVSLVLLCVVAWLNPAKVGSYLWIACKLALAAVLGYGFDRAAFYDSQPSSVDGLERAMAQTRRGTLMAASLVAAGLMP